MIIFPAIDISNGKCVRLKQGREGSEDVFYDSPLDAAKMWESLGAEYLHIVDLDGAFSGRPVNMKLIKEIAENTSIPVQLGGGIRTLYDIENAFNIGINRVILGTSALLDRELVTCAIGRYGDKIAVSIDAYNGYAAVKGWTDRSSVKASDLGKKLQSLGLQILIYTDISRDGMLLGPNFKEIEDIKQKLDMKIIASGGVSTIDDVKKLHQLGVYGTIIGKALYTGKINLKDIGGIGGAC